jgi:hypothetical protein
MGWLLNSRQASFKPLDHRGFYTRYSFLEKKSSERAYRPLCTEDGHAFLGSFLEEVEWVLQWVLAVMTLHYTCLDLQRVSEGFVDMPDADLEKLVDAAEAPGVALAVHFEDEVVPPPLDL